MSFTSGGLSTTPVNEGGKDIFELMITNANKATVRQLTVSTVDVPECGAHEKIFELKGGTEMPGFSSAPSTDPWIIEYNPNDFVTASGNT